MSNPLDKPPHPLSYASEVVLRPRGTGDVQIGLLAAALLVGGVLLLPMSYGWVGIGSGVAIAAWRLLRHLPGATYLRIDGYGFTSKSLLNTTTEPWDNIEALVVTRYGTGRHASDVVAYRCVVSPHHQDLPRQQRRKIARQGHRRRGFGDYDGFLIPEDFGLTPQQLLDLMEEWRSAGNAREHAGREKGELPTTG